MQLLNQLKDDGYGATGALRNNHGKCPLTPIANFKKMPRSTAEYIADLGNSILVCKWMDNSAVTIASTCNINQALSKVKRDSKKEKKRKEIDCPNIIKQYNKHIGGTDRQDQNIAKYRRSFRGKSGTGVSLHG